MEFGVFYYDLCPRQGGKWRHTCKPDMKTSWRATESGWFEVCFYYNIMWGTIGSSFPWWSILGCKHGFKNRTGHWMVFFLISSSTPVFAMFLTGCWLVLGVLTGLDWLPVPGWTGRTGRSGLVFKTMAVRLPSKVFARTTALGKIMMVDNLWNDISLLLIGVACARTVWNHLSTCYSIVKWLLISSILCVSFLGYFVWFSRL